MITLTGVTKDYTIGENKIEALRGVDINFRENEFVAVLGPSGCGKTTLLNIIGGLDKYTTGDMVVNGVSTNEYSPQDWDAYRNNSVGFVFQTYNLIQHQTVLSNIKLALTLSGISNKESTERAKQILEAVGLDDQLYKKPGQLSGGQMQRVAIARALVNDPDILLADEPTGSLDSETGAQIMELLKAIAKTRLVVMVTHNTDMADKYATRIVKLLDGKMISDSDDTLVKDLDDSDSRPLKHISMSFRTALLLSISNLFTKKARTILTAFAGSIGIIGIALILSLSHGMNAYIQRVEEETLSMYPLNIQSEFFDFGGLFREMGEGNLGGPYHGEREAGHIYSTMMMQNIMQMTVDSIRQNNLTRFRSQILQDWEYLSTLTTAIQFHYDIDLNIYKADAETGVFFQVHPNIVLREFLGDSGDFTGAAGADNPFGALLAGPGTDFGGLTWTELIDNQEFLANSYELVAGRWPENPSDIVLITSSRHTVSDFLMYSLGLFGPDDFEALQQALASGGELPARGVVSYHFNDILALSYRLVLPVDRFAQTETGWVDISYDAIQMASVIANSKELNIVGILRPQEGAVAYQSEIIGFTSALTEYIIEAVASREIVRQQLAEPEINVFTGQPFEDVQEVAFGSWEELNAFIATLPADEQEQAAIIITAVAAEVPEQLLFTILAASINRAIQVADFDSNLRLMNFNTIDTPSQISLFPSGFEQKEAISRYIAEYNERVGEDYAIHYTDFISLLLGGVTTVVNSISSLLIAFVSIALFVSSIMIGIITYISVLERTKEIGILRSIGASRRDISRVFNTETVIIGLTAGLLGIFVAWLLIFPANWIISLVTGISGMAVMPVLGAVILILISMVLSFVAGIIPSSIAANKDPVVALRTE